MAVIDISQTPLDINAPTKMVMARIKTVLQQRQADSTAPLIVVVGEYHDAIYTQLLQIAVMKACKDSGFSIAFGMEYPKNLALNLKSAFNSIGRNSAADRQFWQRGDLHEIFLSTDVMAFHDNTKWRYKARFCHDYCIPVAFNDAVRDLDGMLMLDKKEAGNSKAIGDLGYQEQTHFPLKSPVGVHIRNLVMMRNLMAHINNLPSAPQIYVQMVGNAHVVGDYHADILQRYPYHESMDALLRENGHDTFAIVFEDDDAMPCSVENNARSADMRITGAAALKNNFENEQEVAAYIDDVAQHSAGAIPRFVDWSEGEFDALQDRLVASYKRNMPRRRGFFRR